MKSTHLKMLALLSLSLAVLAACSDGIYSTIETEKKTATNTLSQTMWVFDIAVPAAGTYYVAAGAIFKGTLGGSTVSWTPNASDPTRPWNPTGLLCNAMALFGPNLYGGFIVPNSGAPSLYQSSTTPFSFATGATVGLASAGEQVTLLRATSLPMLLLGGATLSGNNYVYQLDYSTDGTTWATSNLTNLTYPIVGVGYDSLNGAALWAASGTTVYKSTNLVTPSFSTAGFTAPATNGDVIKGLVVDTTNGIVFVTTKSNGVFYTQDGGATAWAHIGADVIGTATVSYLTVAGPVAAGKYLVGSDGFGYYTLAIGGGMSRFGDSTIALYSASVSHIALDLANNVVLLGTYSKGLWRAVFDPGTGELASGQSWINE